MTVPATVRDEAPKVSTRESRALDLYRTRGHERRHAGEDVYLVPSCSGRGFYEVRYGAEVESCNCPDHEIRRENCKHILSVAIHHAKCRGASRPCACVGGLVFIGYLGDNEVERFASYRCRRCSGETS